MENHARKLWVETMNNMGYMSLSFDPFTERYLAYCANHPGIHAFEGGAAYGIATHLALKNGATVTANDSDPRHLEELYKQTPDEFRPALTLAPGKLPYDVDFQESSFDVIYTSRMLHFLNGTEVEDCMKKFFHWLKKGGRIFIVVESPYLGCYSSFIPIYEERKMQGNPWPGEIRDTSPFKEIRYNNIPGYLNFFDPEIMTRIAQNAGFLVEEAAFINRKDFPPEIQLDGRESVGLIARKPL